MDPHITRQQELATAQQIERLRKRIRLAITELTALASRLPARDEVGIQLSSRAEQHEFDRRCVCLEVALDEATRWARSVLAHVNAHREQADSMPNQNTLQAIDQLLGQIAAMS